MGALSAAIITLPMAIGYGVLAFAPLGPDFINRAVTLGIYSAVFAGFIAAWRGGSPIQISGPGAPLTLIYATLISSLVATMAKSGGSPSASLLVAVASVALLIAGITQLLMGVLDVGKLIKYVPHPVVAGFMNGIAFILMMKQFKVMAGLSSDQSFWYMWMRPDLINFLSLASGLATVLLVYLSSRYIKKIPAFLVAIVGGTAIYYLISATDSRLSGELLGHIQIHRPDPFILRHLIQEFSHFDFVAVLPTLLVTGLLIGLIASMESLLSAVVEDSLTGGRHDSRKELIGQGLGNLMSGFIGSIPIAGSTPRSMANFNAGGRTRNSGMLCSVFLFLIVLFLGKIIGMVPLATIAGIIFVIGWRLIDGATVIGIKRVLQTGTHNRDLLLNLGTTIVVAVLTICIDLVTAIAIGILIASGLFIVRMSRSIVKRKFYGDRFHSRKRRTNKNIQWLEEKGTAIVVLELQGPLFFGSAENLTAEVENLLKTASYCILSFKRVNEIDSTAAAILVQLKTRVRNSGKHILFSQIMHNGKVAGFLSAMDMARELFDQHTFADTDAALEWAEDHLLDRHGMRKPGIKLTLSEIELFKGFASDELGILKDSVNELSYRKNEAVFTEGDLSRDLYLLASGAMSVLIYLPEKDIHKRLFTYAPGVVFGEMSFLDGNRRSATVLATQDSKVLRLAYEDFVSMTAEQPALATKIMNRLAMEISGRLRRTSNQLRVLEDS